MILTILENSVRNFSFLSLFFTMLFYWIKASFFYTKKSTIIENFLLIACNLLLVSILLIRWIDSNHFPISNLYESLIFLSWSILTFLLVLQMKTKESFLGIILTPIILFITTFATFSLPIDMQKSSSLVPALQSNWLMMHVTIMMLSYAALICGSLLSITFLVVNKLNKNNIFKKEFQKNPVPVPGVSILNPLKYNTVDTNKKSMLLISTQLRNENQFNLTKNSFSQKLDNLSYRTIGIGFPLLTIGILSGAVWANETWGSYWNWDPKETWALITWLIYSIYLHSRIIQGSKGEKPAIIATVGFLAVWVCYLGVNIFGKGLHSYGWFTI